MRHVRGDSRASFLGQTYKNYIQRFSVVDFDDVGLPHRQFDLRSVAGVLSRSVSALCFNGDSEQPVGGRGPHDHIG